MAKKPKTQVQKHNLYQDACDELLQFFGEEMPKMGNWTPEKMVDMVGLWKELSTDLEKYSKTLNGLIDARISKETTSVSGSMYVMKLTPVTQNRVNAEQAQMKVRELCKRLGYDEQQIQREIAGIYAEINMVQHRYDEI